MSGAGNVTPWACQTGLGNCLCHGGFALEDIPQAQTDEERAMYRCLLDRIVRSSVIDPLPASAGRKS